MKHYLDLRQHVREERGAVAVIAIMMTTLMVLTGLAFLAMAQSEDLIAANFRNKTQAFYAAEAGLESGLVDLRTLLAAH